MKGNKSGRLRTQMDFIRSKYELNIMRSLYSKINEEVTLQELSLK